MAGHTNQTTSNRMHCILFDSKCVSTSQSDVLWPRSVRWMRASCKCLPELADNFLVLLFPFSFFPLTHSLLTIRFGFCLPCSWLAVSFSFLFAVDQLIVVSVNRHDMIEWPSVCSACLCFSTLHTFAIGIVFVLCQESFNWDVCRTRAIVCCMVYEKYFEYMRCVHCAVHNLCLFCVLCVHVVYMCWVSEFVSGFVRNGRISNVFRQLFPSPAT